MNKISLPSKDGKSFDAWFFEAAEKDAPGLVLVQEIFGVNASMRAAAERWASLGFNVIVPDLFWREEAGVELDPTQPEEFNRGIELMQKSDENLVVSDLEVARQWLADRLGKQDIATLGYCWGGRLVVRMAADTGIKCAVSYYGVGLDNLVPSLNETAAPTLLHIAELDSYVPEAARQVILDAVAHREGWEAHVYEGCDHAFARPNGAHRNEEAARLAEERSVAFMRKHVK